MALPLVYGDSAEIVALPGSALAGVVFDVHPSIQAPPYQVTATIVVAPAATPSTPWKLPDLYNYYPEIVRWMDQTYVDRPDVPLYYWDAGIRWDAEPVTWDEVIGPEPILKTTTRIMQMEFEVVAQQIEELLDLYKVQGCPKEILPYHAALLGTPLPSARESYQRSFLANLGQTYRNKGTPLSFFRLFESLGFELTLQENYQRKTDAAYMDGGPQMDLVSSNYVMDEPIGTTGTTTGPYDFQFLHTPLCRGAVKIRIYDASTSVPTIVTDNGEGGWTNGYAGTVSYTTGTASLTLKGVPALVGQPIEADYRYFADPFPDTQQRRWTNQWRSSLVYVALTPKDTSVVLTTELNNRLLLYLELLKPAHVFVRALQVLFDHTDDEGANLDDNLEVLSYLHAESVFGTDYLGYGWASEDNASLNPDPLYTGDPARPFPEYQPAWKPVRRHLLVPTPTGAYLGPYAVIVSSTLCPIHGTVLLRFQIGGTVYYERALDPLGSNGNSSLFSNDNGFLSVAVINYTTGSTTVTFSTGNYPDEDSEVGIITFAGVSGATFSDTAPAYPGDGDYWIDTTVANNHVLYQRWSGSWVSKVDPFPDFSREPFHAPETYPYTLDGLSFAPVMMGATDTEVTYGVTAIVDNIGLLTSTVMDLLGAPLYFENGMYVYVAGFVNPVNNGLYKLLADPSAMGPPQTVLVQKVAQDTLITEAAGATVTFTNWAFGREASWDNSPSGGARFDTFVEDAGGFLPPTTTHFAITDPGPAPYPPAAGDTISFVNGVCGGECRVIDTITDMGVYYDVTVPAGDPLPVAPDVADDVTIISQITVANMRGLQRGYRPQELLELDFGQNDFLPAPNGFNPGPFTTTIVAAHRPVAGIATLRFTWGGVTYEERAFDTGAEPRSFSGASGLINSATINYTTGAVSVTFNLPAPIGTPIMVLTNTDPDKNLGEY